CGAARGPAPDVPGRAPGAGCGRASRRRRRRRRGRPPRNGRGAARRGRRARCAPRASRRAGPDCAAPPRAGAAGSPGRRPRRAARGPRRRIRWSGAQARTPDHRTDGGRSEVDLRLGCLIPGRGTADAELGEDLLLDLDGELGVVPQEAASVFLALAELVPLVGEPGTGLAHDPVLHAEVDEPALPGDAPAVEDVELGLLERRGHLVLDDLGARAVADRLGALLEGLDAAD